MMEFNLIHIQEESKMKRTLIKVLAVALALVSLSACRERTIESIMSTKAAQTQLLAKILSDEAEKGNYVIAGGDFNQVFSNSDQDAFPVHDGYWAPGEVDVSAFPGFTALQDSSVPSCRSLDRPLDTTDENFQYYLIDGFIVSDNLQINSIRTEDLGFKNSDHNPVTLTVTIP